MSDTLNPAQWAAIRHVHGPLLVLAGAGSGKTRVITHKIVHLIKNNGVAPSQIYAVTFTNKAANEMQSRLNQLLTTTKNAVHISTFHALGLSILKKHIHHLGLRNPFTIVDQHDCFKIIQDSYFEAGITHTNNIETVRMALDQISQWKNLGWSVATAFAQVNEKHLYQLAQVYDHYQHYLKTYNTLDLDDLIYLPLQLFRHHPEILAYWQQQVRYLLVDEYQDTNMSQYELMKLLAGVSARFTVVGDDDQSIYSWRGAQPQNLSRLQQDFPLLTVIKLEQNYRSTQRILRAANRLIDNNPHVISKTLWSDLGQGEIIRIITAKNEEDEVQRVATEIKNHLFKFKTEFNDYAVLYRGNFQAKLFERKLRELDIPYYLSGSQSFFDRSEIKDIIAYLRLMANGSDDTAFLRVVNVPRRKIGSRTMEKLQSYAKERQLSFYHACLEIGLKSILNEREYTALNSFAALIDAYSQRCHTQDPVNSLLDFLKSIQYEQWLVDDSKTPEAGQKRYANVLELIQWIKRLFEKDAQQNLADILSKMMVMNMLDKNNDQDKTNRVHLMTLHAAKGLEFPHVYIVGMEENLLPHHHSMEDEHLEEERRLTYVGMTRAQKTLTFSLTEERTKYGQKEASTPSRFLYELPQEDIHWENQHNPSTPALDTGAKRQQLSLLKNLLKKS